MQSMEMIFNRNCINLKTLLCGYFAKKCLLKRCFILLDFVYVFFLLTLRILKELHCIPVWYNLNIKFDNIPVFIKAYYIKGIKIEQILLMMIVNL